MIQVHLFSKALQSLVEKSSFRLVTNQQCPFEASVRSLKSVWQRGWSSFPSVLHSGFLFLSAQADLPEVPPRSQREATGTVHHRRAFICQTVLTLTHAGFPTTSFSRQRFFGLTCATKCESAKRNLNKCHVCLSGCPFSAPWASLEETLPGLRPQRPQSVPPEHRGYPSCCLFLPLCTTDDRHSFLLWNMWLNFYSAFST